MGALKINCYCNEIQMTKIVKAIYSHLDDFDSSEVSDFDDTIGDVRVCVEFENYVDGVQLKASEVLDQDWDLLYEDTAVFTSRLRLILEDYNNTDALYAEKAETFSLWFGKHFDEIVRFLCNKQMYNEDAVSETYLRIYESILYTGLRIEDYKSYFMRAFYTNFINSSMHNSRYSTLTPNYDRSDAEDGYFSEIIGRQEQLEENIFNFIYARYDIREFELFKMYISLKPAVNYYSLAEITGIKVHNIQRTISKIKKDILKNKSLIEKGIIMETVNQDNCETKQINDGYALCRDYDLL